MRARHLLLVFLLPLSASPPDKVTLQWGMKPHDFLHYRSCRWGDDQGKQVLRDWLEHPVDVFGCDFDKDGRFAPRIEGVYDLALPLVFQAPDRAVAPGDKWKVSATYELVWAFPKLSAAGASEYVGVEDLDKVSCHVWKGVATIEEDKGKTANVSRDWLGAKVEWKTWFEADPGVARRVEVSWSAKYIGKPKASGEVPTELVVKEELSRGELWRDRYEKFQEKVNAAIDKGVAWVKGQQGKDGNWGAHYDYTSGPTALALLTLIKGGVKKDDASVKKGIAWLVDQPLARVYEVAISMLAVDAYYTPMGEQEAIRKGQLKEFKRNLSPEHLEWMKKAVAWMERAARDTGEWGYVDPSGRPDLSNTQYAILGLHAAGRCGVWADEDLWLRAFKQLVNLQQPQGPPVRYTPKLSEGSTTEIAAEARGFPYEMKGLPTGSMTCAGVACIALCRDALSRMKAKKWTARENAKALSAMKDGVGWLSEHYHVRANDPIHRDWYFYYLYGLERAGTLAEFDRLSGHDWYYEGACVLLATQHEGGHWQDSSWVWLHDTCFAVLFLKRATTALPTK